MHRVSYNRVIKVICHYFVNMAKCRKRAWKKQLLCAIVITCVTIFVVSGLLNGDTTKVHYEGQVFKITYPNNYFVEKPVKKILMWTDYFEKKNDLEGHRRCLSRCPFKCTVTDDKAELDQADAVEFHLSDIWTKKWRIGTKSVIQFPASRAPAQRWIVSNMEPPPHLYGNIEVLNGIFNWTRWYRHDGDIMIYYGKVYRFNTTEEQKATAKIQGRNFFREKSREATLMISNCFDPGQRYRLISQLDQYLDIEKYGACYKRKCGNPADPKDKECEKLIITYKFYLAFENDNCEDYVTEKYWHTLTRDQIPIVNWKNISPFNVIPNSYINIYDFPDIESAADYIRKVSVNETLFNSYFEWRKYFTNRVDTCTMCDICTALHNKSRPGQVYTDLDGWVRDDFCDKVELWNNFMKNVYGWRFYLLGF